MKNLLTTTALVAIMSSAAFATTPPTGATPAPAANTSPAPITVGQDIGDSTTIDGLTTKEYIDLSNGAANGTAQEAQSTAADAERRAGEAEAEASAANNLAGIAISTAADAHNDAAAAQETADANSDRLDTVEATANEAHLFASNAGVDAINALTNAQTAQERADAAHDLLELIQTDINTLVDARNDSTVETDIASLQAAIDAAAVSREELNTLITTTQTTADDAAIAAAGALSLANYVFSTLNTLSGTIGGIGDTAFANSTRLDTVEDTNTRQDENLATLLTITETNSTAISENASDIAGNETRISNLEDKTAAITTANHGIVVSDNVQVNGGFYLDTDQNPNNTSTDSTSVHISEERFGVTHRSENETVNVHFEVANGKVCLLYTSPSPRDS